MFANIIEKTKKNEEWYARFDTFDDLADFIKEQGKACTIYPPSMCTIPNKKNCWLIVLSDQI